MSRQTSPYWTAIIPGIAVAAGALRWLLQGSGNVYTAWSRRYYVPDPDLGWRVVHDGPMWLGLEALGLMAAVAVAVVASAWLIRRRERRVERTWSAARTALWSASVLPLAVPILAFVSGFGPGSAHDQLPAQEKARVAPAGIRGAVASAPAGTYRVITHEGSAITARINAGGESFDTRFGGNIAGQLTLDPADLTRPVQGSVRVDAASVDTGITMRSNHAREYLKAGEFPELRLTMAQVLAAQQGASAAEIEFWARGHIDMMGQETGVTITGTVRAPDEAGRQRLGITSPALVVSADFLLDIMETPLAGDAGDFDQKEIPIHASLVLALETAPDTSFAKPTSQP